MPAFDTIVNNPKSDSTLRWPLNTLDHLSNQAPLAHQKLSVNTSFKARPEKIKYT